MTSKSVNETLHNTNYLQFYSLMVVSKIVKNQKHQRKTRIFGDYRMISALYEFL